MLYQAAAASIYHRHHWQGARPGWLLPASILGRLLHFSVCLPGLRPWQVRVGGHTEAQREFS
jgi:hypothetical protein